eukprot:350699-Chlamydomonas_euryale.AAC.12
MDSYPFLVAQGQNILAQAVRLLSGCQAQAVAQAKTLRLITFCCTGLAWSYRLSVQQANSGVCPLPPPPPHSPRPTPAFLDEDTSADGARSSPLVVSLCTYT